MDTLPIVTATNARPVATATGQLAKTPLAHLLVYVHDRRLSGSLELVVAGAPPGSPPAGTLVVVAGRMRKMHIAETVPSLGRVLVELGKIDDARERATARDAAAEKRLHGELLVERGLVTREALGEALDVQAQRKMSVLFRQPGTTTFSFYDGVDLLPDYAGEELLDLDLYPPLWMGVRDIPSWEHVRPALAKLEGKKMRLLPGADLERFGFDRDEMATATKLKARPLSVQELTIGAPIPPRVAQLLAYVLLITRQIEPLDPAQLPPAPYVPPAPPAGRASSAPSATATSARPSATMRAAPVAPPDLSPEHAERWKEILETHASIDKKNYFEMLGIPRTATPEEAQAAFFQLAKKWHPDRLPAPLVAVKTECQKVFARYSEAHQTLMDEPRRNEYMRLLTEGGATPDEQAEVQAVVEAMLGFQKAEVHFRQGNFAQAEEMARMAWTKDPTQADYLALLAWLEAMKPEGTTPAGTAAAIAKLDEAMQLNAKCERAYYFRGQLHKRGGNHGAAAKDFTKVTQLNPRNVDAAREVRVYQMRGTSPPPAGDKPQGLLGKLFKK